MNSRIRILPEDLCNKIAAGEVVERPASVVKELLENSLDAGATEIRIEAKSGGKRLIRVLDNGEGMARDDVFLAIERHATSKLRSDEDLFRLRTLGFRGEALPSIASVSRFILRSCPADTLEGWEIVTEGGTVKRAGAVGMARGTCVEVHDLFFNTPARRKFLRRDETEFGHIADTVTKLALGHPQVQFRLLHNDKPVLEAFRQGGLAERVAALLGRPLLRDLLPVDAGDGELRLHGFLAQPSAHRSSAGAIYTFINGRYIRDRVVQHALLDGYRPVLEKGRYPVAILFLEIPPDAVDVNVHPTKHEVRFREQSLVHAFISGAVRQVLRPGGRVAEASDRQRDEALASSRAFAGTTAEGHAEVAAAAAVPAPSWRPPPSSPQERVREALLTYARRQPAARLPALDPPRPIEAPRLLEAAGFFSRLQVIGQYRRSYLLCQDGDDLLLIDQHAAHERIGFERLKAELAAGRIESQALLLPVIVEFDFREAALLQENLEELARFGFELEPFGGRTFALKCVPRLLGDSDSERLLRDVAAELAAVGRSGAVEAALDQVLQLIACHGAVRANRALSPAEIRALLEALDGVDFKMNCPHGRPVMQRLTLAEIERLFRRS